MAPARWRRRAALAGALGALAGCAIACDRGDGGDDPVPGVLRSAYARVARLFGDGPDAPGRWRRRPARDADAPLSEEERDRIARLGAIGYVDGSQQAQGWGVARYERGVASPGLNFFTSGHGPEVLLMDMNGRILHRWRRSYEEIFPDEPPGDELTGFVRRAHLLPEGDVLVIFEGRGIARLDRRSDVVWAVANGAHHDLEVASDGAITLLTRDRHRVARIDPDEDIFEDYVVRLDAAGNELWRVSVLEALERSPLSGLWNPEQRQRDRRFRHDIFHTNSVHVLDGRIPMPELAAGNVMVSLLALDAIAVIDSERGEMVWALKGRFRRQHDPTVVDDGHLLLFDNRGGGTASAVLELDPTTAELVWRYPSGYDGDLLYSRTCGAAQRLANGNTLVTESDAGRAFEVTDEGHIVWEFFNPHVAGEDGQYVATLFEVQRLPLDFAADWLAEGEAGTDDRQTAH